MPSRTLQISTAIVSVAVTGLLALFLLPSTAAAAQCSFSSGNLELGSVGEDVRCLQQYLNNNGFTVASSGVGSPGQETNQYQSLTQAAVKRWQEANNIQPATGTFGPLSKAKYLVLTSSSAPTPTTPSPSTPAPTVNTGAAANALKALDAINDARDALNDSENEIEDAEDDGDDVDDAQESLNDARENLLDALFAFVGQKFTDALDFALDAEDSAASAVDAIDGGDGDEGDAEDAIADAEDAIDEAWEAIEEAEDDGDDTDEAEELIEEAEDALDDAQDAFDEEEYEDAIENANDAEDFANEAIDAL